jgi:hypothetical protein
MVGFLGLMLALAVLTCLFTYWISWDIQHQQTRPAFTTKLWHDAVRLAGRGSGGIIASGTQAIAVPVEPNGTHVHSVPG